MQIVEIDPQKKYVITVESAKHAEILRDIWERLLDGEEGIIFIYGENVSILPIESVAGYTILKND